MVEALPKSKITYHENTLSALAIYNFANSIGSKVAIAKAPKPNTDRPEVYWVELK